MNKFENLSKKFIRKGFLIEKVEKRKSLAYLEFVIKNKIFKLLELSKLKNRKISLDSIHTFITPKNLNFLRIKLINFINNDKKFKEHYFQLAKHTIFSIVGNELAMQNNINLSIQLPNDESSLLPLHSDTWSGDSPFEVVLWLPLVNCYKTKSMFILDQDKSEKFRKFFNNKNIKTSSDLHQKFKKDFNFLRVNFGQFLLFNQNLPHGNVINKTKETRLSLNCRFKGLFTPYAQKKLGNFFSPLIVRPASKIGLKYKLPGKETK